MNAPALALLIALAAAPDESAIRISPGVQKVVQVPRLEKVAIADPEIADVTVTGGKELLVLGRKTGQTSITVWTRGSKQPITRLVIVDDGRLASLAALIKEKVNPSLKTDVIDDKLIVDGMLDSVEEYGRLKTLVGDNPDVKLLVRLDPQVMPAVANAITEALRKNGIKDARAVAYGQKIVLEGSTADPEERARAQMIADSLYKDLMAQ